MTSRLWERITSTRSAGPVEARRDDGPRPTGLAPSTHPRRLIEVRTAETIRRDEPNGPPRSLDGKAVWSRCYAPHASMYFDTRGKVKACCQMRGRVMGDVTRQSLREIWDGAAAEGMRQALEQGEFPSGCGFCEWQDREGDEAVLFARGFDHLPVSQPRATWPSQMEFALTNTCNLQCVMCTGDFSSAIRSQREGRPALPTVYDDSFFEQLAEFLPHLTEAKFYGGEPFLGLESLRVLDMLAALDHPPRITITTNATIWTPRVERILRAARPHLVVSLDGASPSTFDAIRVGADFHAVMANVDRFLEILGPDRVSLTHCLMVDNWREFPELLNLAAGRDLVIGVNVLHHPSDRSLYQLPSAEIDTIADSLDARRGEVAGATVAVLDQQVDALRNRARALSPMGPGSAPSAGHDLPIPPFLRVPELSSRWFWLPFPETGPGGVGEPADQLSDGVDFLVGRDGVMHLASTSSPPAALRGLDDGPVESLLDLVAPGYRPADHWYMAPRESAADRDRVWLQPGGEDDSSLVITIAARRDHDGTLVGARYRVAVEPDAVSRLAD